MSIEDEISLSREIKENTDALSSLIRKQADKISKLESDLISLNSRYSIHLINHDTERCV